MPSVILPTSVILNILILDSYIIDAKVMQISSPTFFLLIVASHPPHPAELLLNSSCRTFTWYCEFRWTKFDVGDFW